MYEDPKDSHEGKRRLKRVAQQRKIPKNVFERLLLTSIMTTKPTDRKQIYPLF